ARVRELLIAYPELARAITQPFPNEDVKEDDPDFLPPSEIEARWRSFQKRIEREPVERDVRFWRLASAALAAAVAIAFSGLLWQRAASNRDANAPRLVSEGQLLLPDGQRG